MKVVDLKENYILFYVSVTWMFLRKYVQYNVSLWIQLDLYELNAVYPKTFSVERYYQISQKTV